MKNRKLLIVAALLSLWSIASCASQETWTTADFSEEFPREYMREGTLSLNGDWQVLTSDASFGISEPEEAEESDSWAPISVPGNLLKGMPREQQLAVEFAWVRREFSLSARQAAQSQILKWGMIRHGASVWLNDRFIGEHTAIGPAELFVAKGVLRPGKNRVLLKVPGWSGVSKNAIGRPLIPTGSGPESWGNKMAQIHDDIWIDFYEGLCLNWILAIPDIGGESVTFRIWARGAEADTEFEVNTTVRKWRRREVEGSASTVVRGSSPFEIRVPIEEIRIWAPESPWLYTAEFAASKNGSPMDSVAIRFGMREVGIVDGRYVLNGVKTRFFGSNLVNEWDWDLFSGREDMVRYLYDEARAMNLDSFRTHTCPPPARFANVADEVGTMIFAEFPLLYNYKDFQFTPSDYDTWHKNGVLDATGWVTKLWNHPSIVMWVLTNESRRDVEWESGAFRDHVGSLDPTRPAWRSGGEKGLDEIEDYHFCENMSWYAEGRLIDRAERVARERDPAKPFSCSEYMNFLDPRPATFQRLLGNSGHPYAMYIQAEHCVEHTEVLRRLRYDLILPYMYAGWTGLRNENRGSPRWCEDWPTPMAAALYSSFSPVLSAFDLSDRHFMADSTLEVPILFINDSPADARAEVDLYLTPVNPLFTENTLAIDSALYHRELGSVNFRADSVEPHVEEVPLPQEEGLFYLYTITRLEGKRPAVSQRMLHLADPNVTQVGLNKEGMLLLLGADEAGYRWLESTGMRLQRKIEGRIEADQVIIWSVPDYKKLPASDRNAVLSFVRSGGRALVMGVESRKWQSTHEEDLNWSLKELADLELKWDNSSRAHPYPGVSHPVFANMIPEGFWRLNGLPNKSSDFYLDPDSLPDGARKIMWMENPEMPVLVEIPAGKGSVTVSMLYLKSRLDKSQPQYDPFAERIMLNLLFGEHPSRMTRTEYRLGKTGVLRRDAEE